jgi:CHASE3 domain sensor protein
MNNQTKTYKPMNKGTKSIVEIINELKQTSSRNEKESILKREANVNNEELKYVLFMTYDPSVNFYIKKSVLSTIV